MLRTSPAAMLTAIILALFAAGTNGFIPAAYSRSFVRRPQAQAHTRVQARTPPMPSVSMQVTGSWVNIVAEQQQRDPARLEPLKPLPDVITVRMTEVLALPLPIIGVIAASMLWHLQG